MMRCRVMFCLALLVVLLLFACNRIGPQSTFPTPPSTSYRLESMSLSVDGKTHMIHAAFVTAEFSKVARVQPMLGRYFADEEYQANSGAVAVLSHSFWVRQFGSDPVVVGRTLELNGRDCTVVGVLPKGFDHPERTDLLLPEAASGR